MADADDIERQTLVGQVMEASARLEGALEDCLRACLAAPRPEMVTPMLQRQNFRQQVEILGHTASLLFDRTHPTLVALRRWLRRLERLRRRRNALVHVLLRRGAGRADAGQLRVELDRLEQERHAARDWAALLATQASGRALLPSAGVSTRVAVACSIA